MIGAMLKGLGAAVVDIGRAVVHIVSRQARNVYAGEIDVAAPIDMVWDIVLRQDITYEAANGLRFVLAPLDGPARRVRRDHDDGRAQPRADRHRVPGAPPPHRSSRATLGAHRQQGASSARTTASSSRFAKAMRAARA